MDGLEYKCKGGLGDAPDVLMFGWMDETFQAGRWRDGTQEDAVPLHRL